MIPREIQKIAEQLKVLTARRPRILAAALRVAGLRYENPQLPQAQS
jgi:hypothetical protein